MTSILFDDPQQRRATATLARRPRIPRRRGSFLVRDEDVAQLSQFQVRNARELHPVLEDGHRYTMRRLMIPAYGEGRPAVLERCKNGLRSFF
jgi:hypothetical protein